MMKTILATAALALTVSALPASAYETVRYRGEYNRYNPDGRNPELEQRRETWLLHMRSRHRAHFFKRGHHDEVRAHKPAKRVHRRKAWRNWR